MKLIVLLALRFAVIYGLLLVPWVGWTDIYATYFRTIGALIFGGNEDHRIIRFEEHRETRGYSSIDTRIVLANRDLGTSDGKMPIVNLGLDSRGVGWIPTALTIALILATPLPWRRRASALLWGLILVHFLILISVAVYIWNESTTVSFVALSPFWKQIADSLEYTLVLQYEASFFFPVLIWILVTFRRQDLTTFKALVSPNARKAPDV
jgi:hypothetical protein